MVKILLVEDDQFLAKMYLKKFQVAGYDIEVAHDGEEGWKKIQNLNPDLVLMDIMMPKMNGIEVLEKVKADEKTKKIPVIMLTNLSTTDDADTAMKKGAAKYIIKSDVTPAEILKAAEKILGK